MNIDEWCGMISIKLKKRGYFMDNILSSILVAVITAILSVLGTLFVQKRKNESTTKKCALYLYLNLKQTKADIDKDKKGIDGTDKIEIMPMNYFNPFDYIGVLSDLKDKLSEHEIEVVNNFYENVKKLDCKKNNYFSFLNLNSNFLTTNPTMPSPYFQQFFDSQNDFIHNLNSITNDDEYKKDIVEIISKLQKLKDK